MTNFEKTESNKIEEVLAENKVAAEVKESDLNLLDLFINFQELREEVKTLKSRVDVASQYLGGKF
jgi:hypothetical protein